MPAIINVSIQDITETAYSFGFEDATEGNPQQGSTYFPLCSPQWEAYNEGFLDGAQMLFSLTGVARHVWIPHGGNYASASH
jgi:hypothetical protein